MFVTHPMKKLENCEAQFIEVTSTYVAFWPCLKLMAFLSNLGWLESIWADVVQVSVWSVILKGA